MDVTNQTSRRRALGGLLAVTLVPMSLDAALAQAAHDDVAAAIKKLVGPKPVEPGRVTLEMPPLAENGNSVSLTATVDSPMTAGDHVKSMHVFSEKNPIATVVNFHLGPRAGRAKVSTNIRLATTQIVTVIAAMSDGSFHSGTAEVIVTLAACIDAG